MIRRHDLAVNQKTSCPRCHSTVEHKHGINARFLKWAVVAAWLFYFPANFLPLVSVDINGTERMTSVFNGIVLLLQQDKPVTAAIVMFCSLIVPTLVILAFLLLLLSRPWQRLFRLQKFCVRLLLHLRHWSMMDIYLISFFVTMFKVRDLGEVQFRIGLLAFIGLALCINKLFVIYDKRSLWRLIT